MFAPNLKYTIYCPKCWFSDDWDPRDFGRDYDFTRPFFEQYSELLRKAPLQGLSLGNESMESSPYNNHAVHLKNCYLLFESMENENCAYGFFVIQSYNVLDCSLIVSSNNCYDVMNAYRVSNSAGCRGQLTESIDCFFLRDSDNCQNCFGGANLKNKQYVMFGQQLTKEEYQQERAKYDLGSYKGYLAAQRKAEEFWNTQTVKAHYEGMTQDCSGNYIFQSKNCKECYEVIGVENCKYMFMNLAPPQNDSYDISASAGPLELLYEGNVVGQGCSSCKFIKDIGVGASNIEYSNGSWSGSNQFGCVSARRMSYCILNKQYDEESFNELKTKIKKHMDEMPYVDKRRNIYKYGEFFPIELSPLPYNDSLASIFFPLEKAEALASNYGWQEREDNKHSVTLDAASIPDHINDAHESILNEVIGCIECGRGFRIIKQEYDFLKANKFPLPRKCPLCRVRQKMNAWAENLTTITKSCSRCGEKIETSVKYKSRDNILCLDCYKKEIL